MTRKMAVFTKQLNDTYASVDITASYIVDRTYKAILSKSAISQYPYTAVI
jgi:hypothetical protein